MQVTQKPTLNNALLVSIRTPKMTDAEAEDSLAELSRLVTTLGFKVVGTQSQRQASTQTASVVGAGKMQELVQLTRGQSEDDELSEIDEDTPRVLLSDVAVELADVVVFDCDLGPSQLRNVEDALGVEVLDRTGVIIQIFSRHANTRMACLQVEVARLNYLAPRLRESNSGNKERQMGQGAGESSLALDRRKVRDRLAELKRELADVQEKMKDRRTQRSDQFCVALVGYTNAGKSSMMRALTGSEVLVENKLFATLDTTVRALQPETQPRILVSDTVGFIKKLPHDLVASFISTLDEAHDASLLLYVVDASDSNFRSQLAVVHEVLDEIGVEDSQKLLLLNKLDQLDEAQQQALQFEFPDAIQLSTRNPADIADLYKRIVAFSEHDMLEEEILVPYTAKGIIGHIRSHMRVIKEDYDASGARLHVRANVLELERLKKMLDVESDD